MNSRDQLLNFLPAIALTFQVVYTTKNGQDIKTKQGKMPTIHFVDQADPDWVIVKQPHLLYNSEGLPRIDIHVHNFTKTPHSGFELSLDFYAIAIITTTSQSFDLDDEAVINWQCLAPEE